MLGRPNGSALSQIRTNEAALNLREFVIAAPGDRMVPITVKNEPATSYNGSAILGQ